MSFKSGDLVMVNEAFLHIPFNTKSANVPQTLFVWPILDDWRQHTRVEIDFVGICLCSRHVPYMECNMVLVMFNKSVCGWIETECLTRVES